MRIPRGLPLLSALLLLSACAASTPSSEDITQQEHIDRTVTFAQIKESPEAHRSKVVMLGGEVLSIKRLKDGTRIEVLQLPIGHQNEPQTNRMATQGRFLAMEPQSLDPAVLPPGTRVTIVGEVSGSKSMPLDDIEYVYPVLTVKQLHAWGPPTAEVRYLYQPVYPGHFYFWGPYWRYGY